MSTVSIPKCDICGKLKGEEDTSMAIREFLTEDEVEAMGIRSKRTLQKDRLFNRGLPFVKIRGSIRYRRTDLEDYLERNTTRPGSGVRA